MSHTRTCTHQPQPTGGSEFVIRQTCILRDNLGFGSLSSLVFSPSPLRPYLMFSRTSSFTVLSRSCRYLLRPHNNIQRASFSLTARSHAAINAAMADTSGITADSLKNKLTGCRRRSMWRLRIYRAVIVSPQFESKTMLARHRLVNSALKAEIAAIHAWTPKCYTPEQWQALQQ
ncbi:BolA protein [Penicillium cf. griseofulvum]|nr:BolA protein [Penicillium cf. griseofulvum]